MRRLTILFLFLCSFVNAQVECELYGEDDYELPQLGATTLNDNCNKIRTVVHVIYDSEAGSFQGDGMITREQVQSQIRITNQFLRNDSLMFHPENTPLGYEILLDTIIYHDGVELFGMAYHNHGINSRGSSGISATTIANELAWGPDENGKEYLNSYVVSKIDGSQGGGVQAYAYFPTNNIIYGNYNLFNAFGAEQLEDEYDQLFQLKTYTDLGHTWTHELFHNFAIFHTFQGESCEEETNCLLQGDRICDTEPQTKGIGCTGSCGFVSENVMDYLSQSCKHLVTQGQVDRATLVIQNSLSDYVVCDQCTSNADLNNDGYITIVDVSLMNQSFGLIESDPDFNSAHDLNCDGVINILDVSILSGQYTEIQAIERPIRYVSLNGEELAKTKRKGWVIAVYKSGARKMFYFAE